MSLLENQSNPPLQQPSQVSPAKRNFRKLQSLTPEKTGSPKIFTSDEDNKEEQKDSNASNNRFLKLRPHPPFIKNFDLLESSEPATKPQSRVSIVGKINLESVNGYSTPKSIDNRLSKLTSSPIKQSAQDSARSGIMDSMDQPVSTKRITNRNAPNSIFRKGRDNSLKDDDEEYFNDLDSELDHVLIKFPPLIINPYGRFKYMWDMFMILLLMYFCLVLPLRLCFRRVPTMFEADTTTDFDNEWLAADIVIDFLLLVDIILNFFTAYENDAGLIVFSKYKILKHYITRWFAIDFISTFPINRNIFQLPHIDFQDLKFDFGNYRIWRIVRFIKLVRVLKLNNSIERLFSLMTLNVDKINIIKFGCFITVFMHVTACLWNALAELQPQMGWQEAENLEDSSIFDRYISAIYFGLTVLLTIGFGNIHPTSLIERVIAIIWMFFGIIVYTYIISSLTSSFAKLNQTHSVQQEKDLFFREWNKMFKLPYETLDMILNTIGLKSQSQSTQKMQALNQASRTLAELPKVLYSEIYNSFFADILERVIFFRNKPKQFLIKIMPLLKPTNFTQGDYIYKERDPAMEVFFVVKGRVISKCHDRQQKERAQIFVEGSFFGETDIFLKRNRTVCARAESDCELWKIDKEDFLDVLKLFPNIQDEVEELVRIKEAYRKPIILQKVTLDQEVDDFQPVEAFEEKGIFSALTSKMIKKIQKGKYHSSAENQYAYESLDFEPDLPSPESKNSGSKSILSEAEWKNFENTMTQRLVRRRNALTTINPTNELTVLAAASLQKQFKYKNTGVKRRMLKKRENRETLRKAILVKKTWPSPKQNTEEVAKLKLLEDLQEKRVKLKEPAEIDEIINAKEDLEKVRDTIGQKTEKADDHFEKMLTDAETMLTALEQFQEGLEELAGGKNLKLVENF